MLRPFKSLFKFIALPYVFLEFFATWGFVEKFGFHIFVAEVIISGIIGVLFIARPAVLVAQKDINSLKSLIFSSFGYVIVGILFLIPGILCDITALVIALIVFILRQKNSQNSQNVTQNTTYRNSPNDIIIDGEVIEEDKK